MTASVPPAIAPEFLHAWLRVAADAMLAVDTSGDIVAANPPAERLFGYPSGALVGQPVEVLLPEPLRRDHRAHRATYLSSPVPVILPLSRRRSALRRGGGQFPVSISLTPVTTPDGTLLVATVRDASQAHHARQASAQLQHDEYVMQIGRLALESPDYEQAIQRIPELAAHALGVPSVVVFSTDWRHDAPLIRASTGLSPTMAATLKAAFGEMRFIRNIFASEHLEAITTRNLRDPRFTTIREGLAEAGFSSFAMVPLFGNDEPLGAIAALAKAHMHFGHDEVAFLESIANLLAASVQRSRSEEELAHAHRLEAIGQLTGGIAHDFNNLLTVISGNLQLLEPDFAHDPDARESIAGALRAVKRGSSLTHRLLTFARRQPLQPRSVSPGPLLDDLAQMLRRTLGDAINIRIDCAPNLPDLYADPNELNTALVNLALNARDAMPRGGTLTIAAHSSLVTDTGSARALRSGRYIALEVTDTGIGMAPETRARAFEPFFTSKEAGKGSGLGLPMVYGFANQSGGAVTLDSKLGYGTTVLLVLPEAPLSARPDKLMQTASEPHARPGEVILVVEDEAEVRFIATRFLQSLGYAVLSAPAADKALALLKMQPHVRLLFSDVMLGSGMNGIELAQAARRVIPGLAVLLTSGYEGRDGITMGSDSKDPFFEFLPKPYRREQLAVSLRRLFDQTHGK